MRRLVAFTLCIKEYRSYPTSVCLIQNILVIHVLFGYSDLYFHVFKRQKNGQRLSSASYKVEFHSLWNEHGPKEGARYLFICLFSNLSVYSLFIYLFVYLNHVYEAVPHISSLSEIHLSFSLSVHNYKLLIIYTIFFLLSQPDYAFPFA